MKRILVLGEIPNDAQPESHLLAGPWCVAGHEEQFPDWEKRFTFAPEPFVSADDLDAAATESCNLAALLLPQMAEYMASLNQGLQRSHLPLSYWEIALGPWLALMAQTVVDHQHRVQIMLDVWGTEELELTLLPANCTFSFCTESAFQQRGILGHAFNTWIFSRLLEPLLPPAWEIHWAEPVHIEATSAPDPLLKRLLKPLLFSLRFPPVKGFSLGQCIRFSLALWLNKNPADNSHPWQAPCPGAVESEKIEALMPIFTAALPLPLKNAVYPTSIRPHIRSVSRVASVRSYSDTDYRLRLAAWRARGDKLIYIQHGGNYGHIRSAVSTPLVEYSQHAFMTWGWTEHGWHEGSFQPVPHAQLAAVRNAHKEKHASLVLVGTDMGLFPFRLDSRPQPTQMIVYREDKKHFLEALPQNLREHTLYRPYFPIPNALSDGPWVQQHFPEVRLCTGNLDAHMLNCRLMVLDHHGTTLSLALAANTPLILYWNTQFWNLCPEALSSLKVLEDAGIFHRTPQSAAAQCAAIWDDVTKWWESPLVQAARQSFSRRYALTIEEDIDPVWTRILRRI